MTANEDRLMDIFKSQNIYFEIKSPYHWVVYDKSPALNIYFPKMKWYRSDGSKGQGLSEIIKQLDIDEAYVTYMDVEQISAKVERVSQFVYYVSDGDIKFTPYYNFTITPVDNGSYKLHKNGKSIIVSITGVCLLSSNNPILIDTNMVPQEELEL
jgi:hypothetical protein